MSRYCWGGVVGLAGLCGLAFLAGCPRSGANGGSVVVYTSVDQLYADEIFALFTGETGIRVDVVPDAEAGKTTGLYARLLAERDRPRADVFWNGEVCRTVQLAEAGVAGDLSDLVPEDLPERWVDRNRRWAAFGLRARVIVFNTQLVTPADAPKTLEELTQPTWRDKVLMANPLFGTTATHTAALYQTMGDTRAEAFLAALKANGVRLELGNSTVRDKVGRGEAPVGLTDTDDVFVGLDMGMPLDYVVPDQDGAGAFAIPNSVMLVAGGPNPENARRLVRFLLSRQVEERLAFGRSRQVPVRADVPMPEALKRLASARLMEVDYVAVARRMTDVAQRAERMFEP